MLAPVQVTLTGNAPGQVGLAGADKKKERMLYTQQKRESESPTNIDGPYRCSPESKGLEWQVEWMKDLAGTVNDPSSVVDLQ
jgi:hypothetical protein